MKKLLLLLLLVPMVSFGQTAGDLNTRGLSKAIEIDPDYAYNNRGSAKYNLGDLNGACADFRKTISLGITANIECVRDQCN